MIRPIIFWLALLSVLSACSSYTQPTDHFGDTALTYDRLANWRDDDHVQALDAFKVTCVILANKPLAATSITHIDIPPAVWQSLCDEAQLVPLWNNEQSRLFFERRFVPYRIINNGKENGLFTGYYEPVLYGSLTRHGNFIYPLYKHPPDLKNGRSYYTHAQIDHGALNKRGLELVWVDDPVMIFFLHIQGSGQIRFENGETMLVGYAGQNNRAYVSLGKIMGDEGLLSKDDINFFTIRKWLYDHPAQAFSMMERNPSYVFFKQLEQSGPVGAVGTVLTPERSLAVDHHYIPYGLPLFLETELPNQNGPGTHAFHRTVIAQDTGGAIRGPIRGDIFFGIGADAEYLAGYMKGHGNYSLLVPREIVSQMQ